MARKLAVVPELEHELDRLYGLPLEDFTAARNELASRLRKAGQAAVGEQVRGLRKPSVAIWTVNQLARRRADELQDLLAAGERLRKAQEAAFRGEGAAAVREATASERRSIRALTRLARSLLTEEGRAATQPMLERVAETLRASAVDPDAASLLAAGRLPDEVEAPGFSALAQLAPPPRKRTRAQPPTAGRAAKRRREQRLRELRTRADELRQAAADAELEADRLRAEATAAAEELAAAERDTGL